MNRAAWLKVFIMIGLLTWALSPAFGQGGTGEITGLVTDPSGAIVSNASVTLTNSATGQKLVAQTTSAGTYRFPALTVVGVYSLEVTAQGFRTYKVGGIIISVGAITNQDVKLQIGTTTETVEVEAGAQQVQTTESSVSGLIDRQVWQSMPLEARSQNNFIGLLAGAEPALQANLTTDRGAAVNGARSGTGNFLVEGFDNNDQGLGGGSSSSTFTGAGGANTTISPDAIQEYRVIEHIPPAEYGKAGGFVTDTVLKSGTNQWHGSLFEYNRIQALAANSWFDSRSNSVDHLVRNQFGGSFGGPIVKDKSFFFFTVEGHKVRSSSPLSGPVMTSSFVNFVNSGAFETFQESDPAGVCVSVFGAACPGAFGPTTTPVATPGSSTLGHVFSTLQNGQHMPLCVPGSPSCLASSLTNIGQGLYTAGLVYPVDVYGQVTVSAPATLNQWRYSGKVDQNIGNKDRINAAYLYDNQDSDFAYEGGDNGAFCCGPNEPVHARAQNAGVTWLHTFSPTVLNQARMAYVRHTSNFPGDPTVAGFPSVQVAFDEPLFAYGNSSSLPQFFTENEFQYRDDLSVTKGKHNLKGGGEYSRTRNGSRFEAIRNGYFLPNSVEDLVTDMRFDDQADAVAGQTNGSIFEAEASINPVTSQLPDFYRGYRANEVAFYVQDDWRATTRLTLNLGVRWEYFGPPHNYKPGIDSNFYTGVPIVPFTGSGNPFMPVTNPFYAGIATGVAQQRNHDIWNKDLNNFGPRLGFAWDVMGNQKFVARGGYGIGYDRMYNNIFENIRFNPPFFAFSLIGAAINGNPIGGLYTPGLYSAPFTSTAAFGGSELTPSLRAMDQNLVTAYYEQANLGFEYQIGKDMVLESNYVGTFGHKLLGVLGDNTFDGKQSAGFPHTPINPIYSNISFRTNCCNSNYSGFQTTLRKRFTSGLQFNVNYTYSKALDDISDTFTTKNASANAYPTDSMNPKFDYGPADFDARHRLVGSFTYELPFAKTNRWLGGWSTTGIVTAQSGSNFSISSPGTDSNKDAQLNDRASWLGGGPITNSINHKDSPANGYLVTSGWAMPNTAALPCPASQNLGLWCEGPSVFQMRRNALVGPRFFDTDFGVGKSFKITESSKLTFQANLFNIFNHPNFTAIDTDPISSTFGQATATYQPGQGGARVTQLALRFDF